MFLLLFLLVIPTVSSLKKCCEENTTLVHENLKYFCKLNEDKRVQINAKQTNLLNVSANSFCYDGVENITKYRILNKTVVETVRVPVNFYPKCCPLSFFYDSVRHSCVYKENLDRSFIKQNFVKIGLPNCRVLVDYDLEVKSGFYRIELGALHIDSEGISFPDGEYCVDLNERSSLIARACHRDLEVCKRTRCIHKCCPDGQSFVQGNKCKNTYVHGVDLGFSDRINASKDPFALIHKFDCKIYILKDRIPYYLDIDGNFYAFYNKTNSFKQFTIEEKSYCIEHLYKEGRNDSINNFQFFMCFSDEPIPAKFWMTRWTKICSCVFIIITIGVYLFLPEMLNFFGKILISYCVSMLAVFTVLTYGQFETNQSDRACQTQSFLSLFTSLASFTWLNIMCFDIWWTFGTPKSFASMQQKKNELKQFFLYSLYGWGVPAILTLLTFTAYSANGTPYIIRPFLGAYQCFFEIRSGNYARFLYYATPLICMEITNIILFIRTIIYCLNVKAEINRMNDTRTMSMKERKRVIHVDKEQLTLILKLSVTMGISLIFEVVSSLYNFRSNAWTEYIEVVWDFINCLQGVFIFFIFIFKRKVFKLCKNRLVGTKNIALNATSFTSTPLSAPLNSRNKARDL